MPSPANIPLNFNRDKTQRQLNARLEELLEKLRTNRPSEDPWPVRRAFEIASERHHDQFRASGDPYTSHLLEVAHILADIRMDATTLAAALLHDVIEDTEFPVSRLEERFGGEVAQLVEGVTKISRLNMMAPEARQAENVRKMLLAMVQDVRVVMVKLADRLHNMRTLEFLEPAKQHRIARETMDIYAPIAHRLGMSVIKGELEDLSFRYLEPDAYFSLQKQLNDKAPFHRRFLEDVQNAIRTKLVENSIPGHVEFLRKTDKREKSEQLQAIEYNVAGVSIRIRQLEFPGAGAGEVASLQTAGEKLTDREYSREFMNSFIDRALLPIYHGRGYLKAACAPPQPKVIKPSDPDSNRDRPQTTFVDVAFPVTPGMQYKLSDMAWSGNKEFPTEALQPLLHVRTGQPANTVQLEDDLKSVQQLYGSHGYILASVKVKAQFDDLAGTVSFQLAVDEGSLYRMGELEFRGIDNNLTARLRAAWKIRPGDVYDATYLKQFLPQARKLLPANLDWEVEPHVTAITRDKTVDVDLQYTAKATQ